jgi:phosphatidylserine/phosphatidylglycerophosphate/cardiolipin synthase-like enzyme
MIRFEPRHAAGIGLLTLAAIGGCAPGGSGEEVDDTESGVVQLSYVGQRVVDTLSTGTAFPSWKGRTWDVSSGNELSAGWLIATPPPKMWSNPGAISVDTECTGTEPGCDLDFHMWRCNSDAECTSGRCGPLESTVVADGQAPTSMCLGHSDHFEDEVYRAIVSAQSYVDISGLWQPTGRFVPAIRNALRRLATYNRPVTVRILSANGFTDGPLAKKHTSQLLSTLTSGLPANAPLSIYVAKHSASFTSWDHAKIIAVDGKTALVGGHNLDTEHYQLEHPVLDLSMRLAGPAAVDAHRFASELWGVACEDGPAKGLVTWPAALGSCPKPFQGTASSKKSGVAVISAGRLGAMSDNASDAALLAMVDAAKHTVHLSQQDLLAGRIVGQIAIAGPPKPLLERLAAAIARGVDVYLVMSNTDGGFFGASYSNDWTSEQTAQKMGEYMASRSDLFAPGTDVVGLLCQKLHVASVRLGTADTWPDGHIFANHAKFVMVDAQAFYLGSQNLYPADLAEFGFIIDSADAAKHVLASYWGPLWNSSKRVAVSGSEAASCVLR